MAQMRAQIGATEQQGFGRLVIAFPDRMDLPPYRVKSENGVLVVEFDEPVTALLPDLAVALPDYITIGRMDPDGRGLRIGLRTAFNLNRIEAAERIYIDLLPTNWQGLAPGLPPEIVAELADRARRAAALAEQQRKIAEAAALKPTATIRVGRNPTFIRVQFDWSADTKAEFAQEGATGRLRFDWPVPVDLSLLEADLPPEISAVHNSVGTTGSEVELALADGVMPRFYVSSPRQFLLDIDIAPEEGIRAAIEAEDALLQARENERAAAAAAGHAGDTPHAQAASDHGGEIVPAVSTVGDTVRITFPFAAETPAAVFRRGDFVWLIFDTTRTIAQPAASDALSAIARKVEILPAGNARVVRLELAHDRLATLGAEDKAWVLSLGDVLLDATEPLALQRRRDSAGNYEMVTAAPRAGTVHVLHDPVVGDALEIVTLLPPARGIARNLGHVDFDALPSAHGLVLRPRTEGLEVAVDGDEIRIAAAGGLTLSAVESPRLLDSGNSPEFRQSYVDLGLWREEDPAEFTRRRAVIETRAADAEGRSRELARLDLAQFYVANAFALEAIGVLKVLDADLRSDDLRRKTRLVRAIADTLAGRPAEALSGLSAPAFAEESDALLWRTMARVDSHDFRGARLDAIAAEAVAESYPTWVRTRFLFAAIRAAVETRDEPLARRLIGRLEFAGLDPAGVSQYRLLQGRIAELNGHDRDAIELYGRVIEADIRPDRAEAVYRTLLLTSRGSDVDLDRATAALAAETLMWRGGPLEADMQKLLAELYFRNHDYRDGFFAVRDAASHFPESVPINNLMQEAQQRFEDLFLNGGADALGNVEALSLYYDFRQLTPAGARGDEMIRNLARRLVRVDLLKQAADLLEYQVDNRLDGIGRAQVAADAALIRLADRDPESALRLLSRTRIAELPPQIERQRRVLEARALIDAGREELAIDLVSRLTGHDAELLRVDGYWRSKNYGTAAEMIETMYSPAEQRAGLDRSGRMHVVKAAVGFALSNDTIGLSRLRSKFSQTMDKSAEWPLFEFVTRGISTESLEFRRVAREVSGLDSLQAFLKSYRDLYPGDGVAPLKPTPPQAG